MLPISETMSCWVYNIINIILKAQVNSAIISGAVCTTRIIIISENAMEQNACRIKHDNNNNIIYIKVIILIIIMRRVRI